MSTALAYYRFSPRPDARECHSIAVQRETVRSFCARRGYIVSSEYSDESTSGATLDRAGLDAAIRSLHRGWLLIVSDLDRLNRDVAGAKSLEKQVRQRGARILSVAGQGTEEDTPDSEFTRTILQAAQQRERQVTALRTSRAHRHSQSHGRPVSRIPPYGYRLVPISEIISTLKSEIGDLNEMLGLQRSGSNTDLRTDDAAAGDQNVFELPRSGCVGIPNFDRPSVIGNGKGSLTGKYHLIPDPAEQSMIQILTRLATTYPDWSNRRLCRELARRGLQTRKGHPWDENTDYKTIARILKRTMPSEISNIKS